MDNLQLSGDGSYYMYLSLVDTFIGLISFAHFFFITQSIIRVLKMFCQLWIHEYTSINGLPLIECKVHCDWSIFIKLNQWNALLESFIVIPYNS